MVLKNKILLIKKAQADMMNLQAVKTGRIIHDISVEKYVRIPYAKAIVRFLFLNCACLHSFSKIYPGFAAILLLKKQDA